MLNSGKATSCIRFWVLVLVPRCIVPVYRLYALLPHSFPLLVVVSLFISPVHSADVL